MYTSMTQTLKPEPASRPRQSSWIRQSFRLTMVLLFASLIQACAHQKDLYYWGDYETLLYTIYAKPGYADPQTQIEKLNTTIERAENAGKQVPPGLFAHLGMIYAQIGDAESAKAALLEEKARYPESSVFINGVLARSTIGGQIQ